MILNIRIIQQRNESMTIEIEKNLNEVEPKGNSLEMLGIFIVITLIIYGMQKLIGVEDTNMNSIIPISIAGVIVSIMSNDTFIRVILIFMSVVILPVVGIMTHE